MNTVFGITFSPPHLRYLGISPISALETALIYRFSHIRLGAYWNEIEKKDGVYDYTDLHTLLRICEKNHQSVVLTVGVKAPRWPEFYYPAHIKAKDAENKETQGAIMQFIKRTVGELKHYSCITHWQVENEPLDRSGPDDKKIPEFFLQKEIEMIKNMDSRPVIVTLWGNDLKKRKTFPIVEKLADIIGIDLYYRQYQGERFGRSTYRGPDHADEYLSHLIDSTKKPVWITELQAEPWEKSNEAYLADSPVSVNASRMEDHIKRARTLSVKEILLWGFEYWLYRANKRDTSFLDFIEARLHT